MQKRNKCLLAVAYIYWIIVAVLVMNSPGFTKEEPFYTAALVLVSLGLLLIKNEFCRYTATIGLYLSSTIILVGAFLVFLFFGKPGQYQYIVMLVFGFLNFIITYGTLKLIATQHSLPLDK